MKINKLKKDIKKQREINLELFNSIPVPSHKDPRNEKAEAILKQWRDGSNKLKGMLRELQEMELANNKSINEHGKDQNIFINGFGEATKRNITCNSYKRTEKRTEKEILKFIS